MAQKGPPAGPGRHQYSNTCMVNHWGGTWRGNPFENKDGAKILIFQDFMFWRQNGPTRPQMTPEASSRLKTTETVSGHLPITEG